jgi:plasmid stabilization system protein ParE
MRLRLTEDAASDLEGIKRFSEDIDTELAARILAQIGQVLILLRRLPHIGHDGARPGTSEMLVPRLPIVVVYRIDVAEREEELIVLRVYHTRRDRAA